MEELEIIKENGLKNYTKFVLKYGIKTTFNSNLVVRSYFTGNYDNPEGLDADFKDCLFKNVTFENVSFEYDDFRNTVFYKAKFINCNFQHSDSSQCSFYECDFIDCDLNETASFANRYINTMFERCSFNRVIIRSGKFYSSFFNSINTSNRLFEDCIFYDTKFNNIKLFLSTLMYNYGLHHSELSNHSILDDQSNSTLNIHNIYDLTKKGDYTPLEIFRLQYYVDNDLKNHEIDIDKIISFETFLDEIVSFDSFLIVAETFSEFLSILYSDNQLETYYMVKVYSIFQKIIQNYGKSRSIGKLQSINWLIHAELEDYFDIEEKLLSKFGDHSSVIVTSLGGLNQKQISSRLSPLSKEFGFEFKLIKRNSPYFIELTASIIPILLIIINALRKNQIAIINKETISSTVNNNKKVTVIEHRKEISFSPVKGMKDIYSKGSNSRALKKVKDVIDIADSVKDLFTQ